MNNGPYMNMKEFQSPHNNVCNIIVSHLYMFHVCISQASAFQKYALVIVLPLKFFKSFFTFQPDYSF